MYDVTYYTKMICYKKAEAKIATCSQAIHPQTLQNSHSFNDFANACCSAPKISSSVYIINQ